MNRIGHYILNGLTLVFALLLIGTAWLWIESYSHPTHRTYTETDKTWLEIEHRNGRLRLLRLKGFEVRQPPDGLTMFELSSPTSWTSQGVNTALLLQDFSDNNPVLDGSWQKAESRQVGISVARWEDGKLQPISPFFGSFKHPRTHWPMYRVIAVHHSFAAIVFALPLTLHIAHVVRRHVSRWRFRRRGLCEKCGYDLRATPTPPADGGQMLAVCPECGHPVARAARP